MGVVQRGGSAQGFGVGPGGDLDRLGQEAVGTQRALLLGEQGEALRGEVGVEGEVGAGAVGARDPFGPGPGLGAEDPVDLRRALSRPVGGPEQNGEEAVDERGVFVQEVLVDGDGARGPVVDPEAAVRQVVELHRDLGPGPAGRFDRQGALDVHRVDVAPAQGGQLGGPLPRVAVRRYVDGDGVRRAEARRGEGALEAAQRHGPPEVDGDAVHRQGDPPPSQVAGGPDAGTGGDQDDLALLDPGQADQPGPLTA